MAYCHFMAQESESRSLDKVIVRLPDGMRDRIKAAAERNNRSMNAEIVAALEERFPAPQSMPFGDMVHLLDTLARLDTHSGPGKDYDESVRRLVVEFSRRFPDSAPGVLKELGYNMQDLDG